MTEELVRDLATPWLRGERIEVMALVGQLAEDETNGYMAGGGDGPECAAFGLYQAAGFDDAWLVITAERLAVLRLTERLDDAELECPFEVPRFALESIVHWKQSEFSGGPQIIQVDFTDASWARLKTDEAGLRALTGPG